MLYIGVLNEISLNFLFGLQVPNVDLPPLCSSKFRPGPPGEQAQAASQFIADVIERYSSRKEKKIICLWVKTMWLVVKKKEKSYSSEILASLQIMFVKPKHYQS